MQLKMTSKKIGSLINEVRTFSNGYFSFNNIDWYIFTSLVIADVNIYISFWRNDTNYLLQFLHQFLKKRYKLFASPLSESFRGC